MPGVFDSLLALAAGAGKGYRASQERQRLLEEAARKAEMEERQLALQEREGASQEAYRSSQIEENERQGLTADLAGERARIESQRLDEPLPGGEFSADILGRRMLARNPRELGDLQPYITEEQGNQGRLGVQRLENIGSMNRVNREGQLRIDNPNVYGGGKEKSDDELGLDAWKDILNIADYERPEAIIAKLTAAKSLMPPGVRRLIFGKEAEADSTVGQFKGIKRKK